MWIDGARRRRRGDRAFLTLSFLWVGVLGACDRAVEDSPAQWSGAVRDSAGLRIVENPGSDGVEPTRGEVLWSYGEMEGSEEETFAHVSDIAVAADGRVFVVDEMASEVVVLTPDGEFAHTIGRPGEGPGELSGFVESVGILGDTIIVPDYASSRVSYFLPDGALGRTRPVASRPLGRGWAVGPDGALYYRGLTISTDDVGAFLFWDGMMRLEPAAAAPDTLFVFDFEKTSLGTRGNLRMPLFVHAPIWAVLEDGRVVHGATNEAELRVTDGGGRIDRTLIRHADWVRSEADAEVLPVLRSKLADRLVAVGGTREAAESPAVVLESHFPAITWVRAGPEGTIWVQRMGEPEAIHPMGLNNPGGAPFLGGALWDVLDGAGRAIGRVRFPPGFIPFRILTDGAVGLRIDEFGVERVVRVRWTGSGRPFQ